MFLLRSLYSIIYIVLYVCLDVPHINKACHFTYFSCHQRKYMARDVTPFLSLYNYIVYPTRTSRKIVNGNNCSYFATKKERAIFLAKGEGLGYPAIEKINLPWGSGKTASSSQVGCS